jgi:hypothetical protein
MKRLIFILFAVVLVSGIFFVFYNGLNIEPGFEGESVSTGDAEDNALFYIEEVHVDCNFTGAIIGDSGKQIDIDGSVGDGKSFFLENDEVRNLLKEKSYRIYLSFYFGDGEVNDFFWDIDKGDSRKISIEARGLGKEQKIGLRHNEKPIFSPVFPDWSGKMEFEEVLESELAKGKLCVDLYGMGSQKEDIVVCSALL